MSKIIINQKEIAFKENQTILEVARENDIYIPTLCYHKKTGPASVCRLCIVEIEGSKDLHTSCSAPAKEGLVVKTNTKRIIEARKTIVNLLLSNGNHDCLSCEANGDCELQDAAYNLGIEAPAFTLDSDNKHRLEKDNTAEFIVIDHKRCIKCGRCITADRELVVNNVLDFGFRGKNIKVICDNDVLMGDSSCVQCGECSQICPVGAIIDKRAIGKGRPWELKKIATLCPYCGVGCQIDVHINEKQNKIVKITGVEEAPCNEGMLCIKGRYGFDFVNSGERLIKPLIRKNRDQYFTETTWSEAIKFISDKFKEIKSSSGPDTIGGLSSAKTTNEENYLFQKFMRAVIGTNNVDHCARLCHASTVAGLANSLGSGAMTNNIKDIDKADVIMVIGSNTTEAHPVIGYYVKQAVRKGKSKLIVVDPKWIELADSADIYVNQKCGSDVAFLNGLMHLIIKNEWFDKEYVEDRCENFSELKEAVKDYTQEKVSKITKISEENLIKIAELFGKAKTASVFYSMGITQHTTGTDNVWSIANLQMLCGNIGKDGGGVNALRGQANVQGACDMGALPNVYPGYQKVTDSKINEKFKKAWGVNLSDKAGLTVTEMIKGAEKGSLKALYIMGENPMLSDPDINSVKKALEKIEFLVVQDIFLTETAMLADIVLPAACFAEKEGLFTNTERRAQLLRKVFRPPGEAKEDWQIITDLANLMGAGWNYTSACDIQEEIRELTPQYGGISWERVGYEGLQWPCKDLEHPGTPVLHIGKFARGKGLMKGIPYKDPDELPDTEYPFILSTGRVLQQFHTGTMTRKTAGLNNLAGPKVVISEEDALSLGLANGDKIKVISRRGEIETFASVSEANIPKGTVFMPFHYYEAAANILTNPAVDPVAKIPEYKVCAVNLIKI